MSCKPEIERDDFLGCPKGRSSYFGSNDPSGQDCPYVRDCCFEPETNESDYGGF